MKKQILLIITAFSILQSCSHVNSNKAEQLPVEISNADSKASCVFLTKDEKNNTVISWTEIDNAEKKHFFFANWDNKSLSFGDKISIPIDSITSIHEEGMPKIAFKGDGTLVATYETSVPSPTSKFGLSNILYIMSFDKGKTWTTPKSIKTNLQEGSCSFGNIIKLNDGELGASWLGTNSDKTIIGRPVMFAKTKGKDGFGDAIEIEPSACQCCRTALSCDENGNVSLVFRNLLSGSVRDISVSNSSDNGGSFNKAIPFSNDNWVIDGCPHNGPSVVKNSKGTYVSWFTGSKNKGVFYAELDANNKMLEKHQLSSNGRFAQLCLTPDGNRVIAFNSHYRVGDSLYNKIMVIKKNEKGYFEKEVTIPKTHASYPVIQSLDEQNVVIAWTDNEKVYYKFLNINDIKVPFEEEVTQPASENVYISLPQLDFKNDPVCGMMVNNKSSADTTLSNGKIVGFCSENCKDMFIKNPSSYTIKK